MIFIVVYSQNNSVNCKQWDGKISNGISLHFRIIAQLAPQCKLNECAVFGCEREETARGIETEIMNEWVIEHSGTHTFPLEIREIS